MPPPLPNVKISAPGCNLIRHINKDLYDRIQKIKRVAILDETVRKRIPHGSATRWNFKSRTINRVYEYREQLIKCMGKIESTSKQAAAINQAGAIRRMLEDSKFVFWLTVFHNIMPHVDVLYNQLQKTRTDAALIRKQVNVFQQSLKKERKRRDTVTKEISASYKTSRKRKRKYSYK
ncbi:hypothetical protein AVEN_208614-1 [Araneus ventricosus]|uniref:Uncharacterized protein n=1 Tax=Araneus ventricosus TaxID=182803 RepID=A0A4Y2TYP8_ARAVE|nr:hypothetical protein AVEN_208614-1 [Araneus ventricosus]